MIAFLLQHQCNNVVIPRLRACNRPRCRPVGYSDVQYLLCTTRLLLHIYFLTTPSARDFCRGPQLGKYFVYFFVGHSIRFFGRLKRGRYIKRQQRFCVVFRDQFRASITQVGRTHTDVILSCLSQQTPYGLYGQVGFAGVVKRTKWRLVNRAVKRHWTKLVAVRMRRHGRCQRCNCGCLVPFFIDVHVQKNSLNPPRNGGRKSDLMKSLQTIKLYKAFYKYTYKADEKGEASKEIHCGPASLTPYPQLPTRLVVGQDV